MPGARQVRNYDDVAATRVQLDSGEIRSVVCAPEINSASTCTLPRDSLSCPTCQVMLNCGAIVDVFERLALSVEEPIRCFVLDSHRPVHLSNIHAKNFKVIVFDDGILAEREGIPVRSQTHRFVCLVLGSLAHSGCAVCSE